MNYMVKRALRKGSIELFALDKIKTRKLIFDFRRKRIDIIHINKVLAILVMVSNNMIHVLDYRCLIFCRWPKAHNVHFAFAQSNSDRYHGQLSSIISQFSTIY